MGIISWDTRRCAKALLLIVVCGGTAFAQDPAFIAFKTNTLEPVPVSGSILPESPSPHRFWDGENRLLFSTVGAFSAADFAITRANLANRGRELNPLTRMLSGSTAGLAVNFAGETAGVVGLSYFLHRTGHHRLERLVPAVNIAASAFAVAFDLAHR